MSTKYVESEAHEYWLWYCEICTKNYLSHKLMSTHFYLFSKHDLVSSGDKICCN